MPRLDRRRSTARVLLTPALIALATALGLAAGLLGEGGGWDRLAWLALALPVAVALWRRR